MRISQEGILDKIAKWTAMFKKNTDKLNKKYELDTESLITDLNNIKKDVQNKSDVSFSNEEKIAFYFHVNNGKSPITEISKWLKESKELRIPKVIDVLIRDSDNAFSNNIFSSNANAMQSWFKKTINNIHAACKLTGFEKKLIDSAHELQSPAFLTLTQAGPDINPNVIPSDFDLFLVQYTPNASRSFILKLDIKDGFWNKLASTIPYVNLFSKLIKSVGMIKYTPRMVNKQKMEYKGYNNGKEVAKDIDILINIIKDFNGYKKSIIADYEQAYKKMEDNFKDNDVEQFFYDFGLQSAREVNYKLLNYVTIVNDFVKFFKSAR